LNDFEIVVIGGGHAGVEAALAAARMGASVALVSLERAALGRMSCNPAVGGLGKGQLVRELDALGGEMGACTDETGIQFRMLNASRGPAVRSPRAQVDRHAYNTAMRRRVEATDGLTVVEGEVVALVVEPVSGVDRWQVRGVRLADGDELVASQVVLTTGTFLGGVCHSGTSAVAGGRHGERAATILSRELERLGLALSRHKTGTPPRLVKQSIDFGRLEPQHGDRVPTPFSFRTPAIARPALPCHITATTHQTHKIVSDNAELSAIFGGRIRGPGPRYCPSIEDKVVRFPERDSHQIFLEPEGLTSDEIYPNGVSTSLPVAVQEAFLRTIPGLENVEIARPGYAVEYDHLVTSQLRADLSVSGVVGLRAAGQINGTSGYEEAAVQGFVAGVNAALTARGEPPLILDRSDSYIGVLIDDLCRVNPAEPYRMFTSRAEHRLHLRQGNADLRLTELGAELGLIEPEQRSRVDARSRRIDRAVDWLGKKSKDGKPLLVELRRPGGSYCALAREWPELAAFGLTDEDAAEVEARALYEPYLLRFARERERLAGMAGRRLPDGWDFRSMSALKHEAREVLARRRPLTLGEAQRLAGVTPADLSVLLVELERSRGS